MNARTATTLNIFQKLMTIKLRIFLYLVILFFSNVSLATYYSYSTEPEAFSACLNNFPSSSAYTYECRLSFAGADTYQIYYTSGATGLASSHYFGFNVSCPIDQPLDTTTGQCASPLLNCSTLICADQPKQCKSGDGTTVTLPACSQPSQTNCTTKPDGTITCPINVDNTGFNIEIKPPELTGPNTEGCVGVLRGGGGVDNVKQVCPGTDSSASCGYVDGNYICLKNEGTVGNPTKPDWLTDPNGNCFSRPDATIFCLEGKSAVKIDSNTTTTDNGNGTSTVTTSTTSNVNNYSNFTVTKILDNSTGKVLSETVQGDAGRTDNSDVVKAVYDVNKTLTDAFQVPSNTADGVSTDNYTKGDKTFSTVFDGFSNRLKNSSLGAATSNVFSITINTGQCPIWSSPAISGGFFTFPSITIDAQCSQTMNNIWPIISAVLMAVASFYALRIALL